MLLCIVFDYSNSNFSEFIILYYSVIFILYILGIPNISIPSTEYTVNYGKEITMNCIVVSNPFYTDVYWRKVNDVGQMKSINNGTQGITGCSVNNPSLTINFATPSDEGTYICLAGNVAGLGQSERIKLTVLAGIFLLVHIKNRIIT